MRGEGGGGDGGEGVPNLNEKTGMCLMEWVCTNLSKDLLNCLTLNLLVKTIC